MTARRPIHPTVFERSHHQRIASVLQGLDGELLRQPLARRKRIA